MNQFSLKAVDHIEIYVFNAFQATNFYRSVFGFNIIAYAGPETGLKNQISYFLRQGTINLVISSSTNQESSFLQHVIKHDESVKDIAFTTNNIHQLYEAAIKAGAISILEPTEFCDGKVRVIKATIGTFGNTVHSFIQREMDSSFELPFYTSLTYPPQKNHINLEALDHIAIALEKGTLEKWRKFYEEALGFYLFSAEDVVTNGNGMKSIVVSNPSQTIKLVLVEGISDKKPSQVENFISSYGCAGVQHLAFSSKSIIHAANCLNNNGVKFLEIPDTYYENLSPSLKNILQSKLEEIKRLNIIVDLENHGYLMQIFTRPIQNRPTFFIEVIQRENSIGFGSNNIKALFEAVEKDQQRVMINA